MAPEPGRRVAAAGGRLLTEAAAAFLAYGAATLAFLRPLATLWRDHLAPDPGDPLFNLYVLKWGMHQARQGFPDPWNANLFHPLPDALTLSDHLFGPALLALPVTELTGSPVAGYNILLFLAFALGGATTYLVLRGSGLGPAAAALGGAVFIFLPYRWEQTSHLQILFAPWIPVALWAFDRVLAEPRPHRAALFLVVYALHLSGGIYLAYMIHVPLAVLALNRLADAETRRRWLGRPGPATLGVTAVLSVAMLTALFLPYLETSRRLGLERGAGEFRVFGASIVSYLTPSRWTAGFEAAAPVLRDLSPRFQGTDWFAEKTLFPGFLPLLLAALGAAVLWRRHRRPPPTLSRRRRSVLAAVVLAAAATFLAADLYTLGFLETPEAFRERVGATYSLLGLVLVLLATIWLALRRRWRLGAPVDLAAMPVWPRGLVLAAACTFLFTFPVIFTPAAQLLPGMSSMRVPARFHVFTAFGLAWLAAFGFEHLGRLLRGPLPRMGAAILVAGLLLLEAAPAPLPWFRVPSEEEFPPAHRWIADHRNEVGALLEIPIQDGPGEIPYLYHSTLHWRPMVNGYSGHRPPTYRYLQERCCLPAPGPEMLEELRRLGVTHLLFHPRERRWLRRAFRDWQAEVAAGELPGVQLEYGAPDGTHVYSITRPGTRTVVRAGPGPGARPAETGGAEAAVR